jgi:hypothetical protein
MALVTCRECSAQVSTEAAICPHCGAEYPSPERQTKQRERRRTLLLWLIILVLLGAGGLALRYWARTSVRETERLIERLAP